MTRLIVAPEAETDTAAILAYLAQNVGRAVAVEYGLRFHQMIERLVEMPLSGAPRSSLGARVRIGIVSPYVLIYEYDRDRDEMTLLRIVHGRCNISHRLLRG